MDPLLRRPETTVKIAHQERTGSVTTEVYPVIDENEDYLLPASALAGTGSPNEPSDFRVVGAELRDFAVESSAWSLAVP
jgi:hypothetical protein